MAKTQKPDVRIEQERGATYSKNTFAVYQYDTYPRSSVLAGQTRRVYLDGDYESIGAALAAYPNAEVCASGHEPVSLEHLPDPDGSDPFGDNEDADNDHRFED